jgi:hypothetical protein
MLMVHITEHMTNLDNKPLAQKIQEVNTFFELTASLLLSSP